MTILSAKVLFSRRVQGDGTRSDSISDWSQTQSSVRYYSVGRINLTFDKASFFSIQMNTQLNRDKGAKTQHTENRFIVLCFASLGEVTSLYLRGWPALG